MTLTFKNLPFLSVSTPWRARGFLIEAAQSYPLHIRSFSLWHLPRDGGEPGKVANNSLRLTASESQMSSILNHLLLTYFCFFHFTPPSHPDSTYLDCKEAPPSSAESDAEIRILLIFVTSSMRWTLK